MLASRAQVRPPFRLDAKGQAQQMNQRCGDKNNEPVGEGKFMGRGQLIAFEFMFCSRNAAMEVNNEKIWR